MILVSWDRKGKWMEKKEDATWHLHVYDDHNNGSSCVGMMSRECNKGNDYKWGHDGNAFIRRSKMIKTKETNTHHKSAQP